MSAKAHGHEMNIPPGFSLRMMRQLTGQPAYWPSCQAVIDAHAADMGSYDEATTPVGSILWFENAGVHDHGNAAMYLGNGWCLRQHHSGRAAVVPVSSMPGDLVGYTTRIP